MNTTARTSNPQLPSAMSLNEAQELLTLYASNPPFRSASDQELVLNENPCRRPVRPEDLEFLDYRGILKEEEVLGLSSLIGHRMLLNINDTDMVLLPLSENESAWREFEHFYSRDNRVLGEMVRSTLETHLFHFLEERAVCTKLVSADDLKDYFSSVFQEYCSSRNSVVDTILSRVNRQVSATTFLIQLLASSLSGVPAMMHSAQGNYSAVHYELFSFLERNGYIMRSSEDGRITDLQSMVRSRKLHDQPHTYWQYYLTSSLALANYAHYVARDPLKFFRYLGALFYQELRSKALASQHKQMLQEIFGSDIDTKYFGQQEKYGQDYAVAAFDSLITPTIVKYGNARCQDIVQGFDEFKLLHEIAEQDLIAQVIWVDQAKLYQEKGRRIYEKIQSENMQLPLDTFVEQASECSTTHIHDAHRLLVIEAGVMHFWNALDSSFVFEPGDITLVPSQRLHGSTVLSGECTYHQPIISDELMLEFNKMF
ncbi:MAG: hypothetical protein JO183_03395 [Ktedonobacteraceae bacterium]|nr:hypothetical protein [Ktedonobacteraceae bacterium]